MSTPLTEADVIFPHLSNTPNLSSTLSSLRRSTLSIYNRLNSITSDSNFVQAVSDHYALPLVANERCGSWYIPPSLKSESVYFKSTDGHMGEWGFSLRRLNLQLVDAVAKWGGAVIVDSTRRGKSMPDALSKTIPIWCCVMNRAIFQEKHELYTPPHAVSASEHAQIEKRIDGFVRQFLDIYKANISQLRTKIQKPLRPIWITQQSSLPHDKPSFPDFHPVVLCTASRRVQGAEASENGYIQGAADDHEAWAHGLTPQMFWKYKDRLMSTNEEDAPGLIAKLLEEEKASGHEATATLVKPTKRLYVSSSQGANLDGFDRVIDCSPDPIQADALKTAKVEHYLHLRCQTGKLGSRDLRMQLPQIINFLESLPATDTSKILVLCPSGKDLSVGTVLAILCLYANEDGSIDTSQRRSSSDIGKQFIKQRLSWITTSNPALNPSRATLQSVNAVLLESQDPKAAVRSSTQSSTPTTPQFHANLPLRETRPVPQEPTTQPQPNDPNDPTDPSPDMPSRIFSALQTPPSRPWRFTRELRSALPTHPSGTVTGTATFTPCTLPAAFPKTLLYSEEGEFVTDSGLRFTARRKYVYQLRDAEESAGKKYIMVRFFDDEKFPRASIEDGVGGTGQGIGGLFVEMGPLEARGEGKELEAKNKETHLCAEDLYTASWKFARGIVGEGEECWWEVKYDVKGPKKDYVSTTKYERA